MPDSKYFGVPFATSGDRSTIPESTQPSGAISFTEGFGPDYELDPATDPQAKRVPRDETNEYLYQITNSVKFLQLYGFPEWFAADGSGNPVSYPLTARVRHPLAGVMTAWVSIAANNTAEPGTDPTKWQENGPFNLVDLEATLPEALAGTISTKIITPRRLASAAQRGAWNYAVASGTANALTVNLSPAVDVGGVAAGFPLRFKASANSSAPVTITVNGQGPYPITPVDFRLRNGTTYEAIFDGAAFSLVGAYAGDAVLSALSRLNISTPTVMPEGTLVIIPIAGFADDGQADWVVSGNTIVCQRAGRYQVLGNFGVVLNTGQHMSTISVGVQKNGAELISISLRTNTYIFNQYFGGAADVTDFEVGDTVRGWAVQLSGATQSVAFANRVSFLRLSS